MKHYAPRWLAGLLVSLFVFLLASQPTRADTQLGQRQGAGQLIASQLPAYTDTKKATNLPYQEQRVGGRLERVTITRANRLTEVYHNNRTDTIWTAEENEIGEVPNMRQWIIGTW